MNNNKFVVKVRKSGYYPYAGEKEAFDGFKSSFPIYLNGIVPPKEYVDAIDYINACTKINKFKESQTLQFLTMALFVLIIPFIVYKVNEYKKKVKMSNMIEERLKACLPQINNSLGAARGINFTYKMSNNLDDIELIVSYPSERTIPIPITQPLISGDGSTINVLPSINSMIPQNYHYSQNHFHYSQSDNPLLKTICLRTGIISERIEGTGITKHTKVLDYPPQLYNYITTEELFIALKEYEDLKLDIYHGTDTLDMIGQIALIFIFGIFILLYSHFAYKKDREQHVKDYYIKLQSFLDQQINQRFSSRGITFKVYEEKYQRKPDLYVFIPKEPVDVPILTTLDPQGTPTIVISSNNTFIPLFQVGTPVTINALPQLTRMKISN